MGALDWLECLDLGVVRKLVGSRSFDLALQGGLEYEEPPSHVEGTIRAVLREPTRSSSAPLAQVGLCMPDDDDRTLLGGCSRCNLSFGPCQHMAALAIDLACSPLLRANLLAGQSTAEAAARAPGVRLGLDLERRFDAALKAWTAGSAEGARLEISASPLPDQEAHLGRPYGDRGDPTLTRTLSITVRPVGEKKLLSGRDLAAVTIGAPDRKVLQYARDRGAGRKAVYASGVEASLTLEAMRAHRGVFSEGFRGLLDFRSAWVRPQLTLCPTGSPTAQGRALPLDALQAFWVPDNGGTQIPFETAVFLSGPFPFVWARTGAIYRVASDVDLDLVARLAAAPVLAVPRAKLKEAGIALLRATRGRGVALPASDAFGLPAVETPRFVVRLSGAPLTVEGQLVAIYGKREISLLEEQSPDVGAGRDLELEAQARTRVLEAGLLLSPETEDENEGPTLRAAGEDAVRFWQSGLLALRGARDPEVIVELSMRLAKVRLGAPVTGRVHVALEGEWLKTRLEFSSKELPVELEAIRGALARKERWVTLDDGTLTRISESIEALAEEAAGVIGDGAEARLPPHQLGRLDRWIEENDGRIDASVRALRLRLRALAVNAEPDMPRGLVATLRPYQRLGLAWLQFLQALGAGGILADDMGLGKTITTLAFLLRRKEAEGPLPSLVVCPTSVASNWVKEAARFTPELRVLLLHGPSRESRARALRAAADQDVVITTYALLRTDIDALARLRFRCVVLDEAQNIKNAESATKRASGRLDASMRLALSGTPIENRLRELWSLSSFANPGILGTQRAFETRFERPLTADRKSPLAAELRATIRPFVLRRTKSEVLKDLPPKTEMDRVVTLSPADKRMYDALAHTLRQSLARDLEKKAPSHVSLDVFTALTRLRQMACDPRLFDNRLPSSRSAKREAFLELVRELVAEGRRALVFSQFVELLTLWRADLDAEHIPYEYLDGGTRKREAVVARFQEGSAPLFLISLKAGGAGLNLTAADTVIHCDPWWNPAVEDQATDRAHRIGQDKPVTVVRLLARGTIEEKMLSLKAKKRELVDVVLGGDAQALRGITQDDVAALLGDADADDVDASVGDVELTVQLANATRVLDPEYESVVAQAQRWLATTGRLPSELASLTDLPGDFAARLARGEPFPCSRAVANRIRARLRDW